MNSHRLVLMVFVGLFALTGSLFAQTTPSSYDDWYSHSIETVLVPIEVKVWDKRSKRLVTDLTKDAFEIIEDGKVTQIEYFVMPGMKAFSNQEAKADVYVFAFIPSEEKKARTRRIEVRLRKPDSSKNLRIVWPKSFKY